MSDAQKKSAHGGLPVQASTRGGAPVTDLDSSTAPSRAASVSPKAQLQPSAAAAAASVEMQPSIDDSIAPVPDAAASTAALESDSAISATAASITPAEKAVSPASAASAETLLDDGSRFHCGCALRCGGCADGVSSLDATRLHCDGPCDRSFHAHCVVPPLREMPVADDGWKCVACVQCVSCGRRTPGDVIGAQWQAGYTLCENCEFDESKYVCGRCDKAWKPSTKAPLWISCDWCKAWYHAACDNINKVTLKKMEQLKKKYMCFKCRDTVQSPAELAKAFIPEPTAAEALAASHQTSAAAALSSTGSVSRRKRGADDAFDGGD
jgi:hypothetical protein